ncbi:MAG: hypothetical protein ACTHMY_26955 [Solirubrobacteraceae bacterium]
MTQREPVRAADMIRRLAPHVFDVYAETRETVLESGIVDRDLKALCGAYRRTVGR